MWQTQILAGARKLHRPEDNGTAVDLAGVGVDTDAALAAGLLTRPSLPLMPKNGFAANASATFSTGPLAEGGISPEGGVDFGAGDMGEVVNLYLPGGETPPQLPQWRTHGG